MNAPDSNWAAGATTLGNKSEQTFGTAAPMAVDHTMAVTVTVRLVAR